MRKPWAAVLVTLLIAASVALTIHFSAHRPNIGQTAFLMLLISGLGCLGMAGFSFAPSSSIRNGDEVALAVFSTLTGIAVLSFLAAILAVSRLWSNIASNFF